MKYKLLASITILLIALPASSQLWWAPSVVSTTSLPISCTPGGPLYQLVSGGPPATAGTVYYCSATNTLTALGSGGGGSFTGPVSSTTNAALRFADTTGAVGKNSPLIISDDGSLSGVKQITLTGSESQILSVTSTGFKVTDINEGFGLVWNLTGFSSDHTATWPDADGTVTLGGNTFNGTGNIVRTTSPALVTPTLGVATVTTVNKVTITQPVTGSTLTINDGKTLTVTNNATESGTNTGDQTITATGDVTSGGCTGTCVMTLKNTGAGAGSCTVCNVTFDAQGRETSYASGSAAPTIPSTSAVLKGDGAGNAAATSFTETSGGFWSLAGTAADFSTANRTTDAVPATVNITGGASWSQAATNTSGSNLTLSGGIGRRFFTIVTFGSTGGKTVTLTTNGTATTLTEGTNFTCVGTSNNTCASNLATAINANGTLGPLVTATASSANVFLDRKLGLVALTIATNAGAPLTATSGTDGQVVLPIGSATVPSVVGLGGAVTGFYWPTTLQFGITTNGASRVLIDNNEVRSSVNMSTAANAILTSSGTLQFTNSSSTVGTPDVSLSRGAAGLLDVGTGTQGSISGWMIDAGHCFVATDQTNATATPASTTCSMSLTTGRKYSFTCELFLSDSVAADGAVLDFNGGSATSTNFRAQVTAFDTALNLSTVLTSLAGTASASTFTGAGAFEIHGSFEPSSTGTFIPRFSQASHSVGTLTLARGSYCKVNDMQ